MKFTFHAFAEAQAGPLWQHHFKRLWPAYKRWFLRYGERDRPTYFESLKALRQHIPEFLPVYEAMVDLAGGGDHAARFLSQYCPPPLFRGCSQAIYPADEIVMVRSYDYSPYVFDGLLMQSQFNQRRVVGMLDCMSGLLDGINSDGLAVSMSFGGREEFADGFGISLVIRYLLEFAADVNEATELICRIPVQGAYNLMLLDREANYRTVELTPGREPVFFEYNIATNHQTDSDWPIYEEKVDTRGRFRYLTNTAASGAHTARAFTQKFLRAPLYQTGYARGFGTLYDAAFYPQRGACEYFWPEKTWAFNFDWFDSREYQIDFIDPEGYPKNSKAYGEVYTSKPIPVLQF